MKRILKYLEMDYVQEPNEVRYVAGDYPNYYTFLDKRRIRLLRLRTNKMFRITKSYTKKETSSQTKTEPQDAVRNGITTEHPRREHTMCQRAVHLPFFLFSYNSAFTSIGSESVFA